MNRNKYLFIDNAGKFEEAGKSLLRSSEVLFRRLQIANSKKNHQELIEDILNATRCRQEKEKVERVIAEEAKLRKRAKHSQEKLPITRRSVTYKNDIKESILPLLPVKRKPLVSRFYNEAQEREIVEAYREAKKIKESFHLAFKYSKSENRSSIQHSLRRENIKQDMTNDSKADILTDSSGRILKIIVTLPYTKRCSIFEH